MGIVVRRNFGRLTEAQALTVEDFAAIGRLLRERIIRRTLQGVDADGKAFAPYSEGYAKRRAKAGLSAQVQLQVSGEMLRGIQVIPAPGKVTLTF